jgi:hypothetical protein
VSLEAQFYCGVEDTLNTAGTVDEIQRHTWCIMLASQMACQHVWEGFT